MQKTPKKELFGLACVNTCQIEIFSNVSLNDYIVTSQLYIRVSVVMFSKTVWFECDGYIKKNVAANF